MSTHKVARVTALAAGVAFVVLTLAACGESSRDETAASAFQDVAEGPNLGMEATHADIATWDIAIGPDGTGLPPGGATAKQGAEIYRDKCSYCHGAQGEGKPADQLAGGGGTLAGDAPVKTVGSYWPYATTLFDYIRRAMPLNEPQSLTNEEVYAVSAHILHLNGLIGPDELLDAQSLPMVKMPNRDNFFIVYPGNLK